MARTSELLVERIRASASARTVVLIDGRAGSGKTTLASEVAYALKAQLVCMDAFYPGWGGLEVGSSMVRSMVLDPQKPGWRRWDWKRSRAAEWHSVNAAKPVVIEGSGALSAANRELATFGIWIRLEPDERRRRKLARDGHLNLEHWDRWALQEDRFFARERPDLLADALVDGATGLIRETAVGEPTGV
jgi:gluconate kinase